MYAEDDQISARDSLEPTSQKRGDQRGSHGTTVDGKVEEGEVPTQLFRLDETIACSLVHADVPILR